MKDKEYNIKEVAEIIVKSMHKSVQKAIRLKTPIEDVVDPNFKPEAPSSSNPIPKTGVMYKKDVIKATCLEPESLDNEMIDLKKPSKNNKLKQFLDKKKSKK
jgi:hypothetical protein